MYIFGQLIFLRDVAVTTQDQIPEQLKLAFSEGLSAELLEHIRTNISPIRREIQEGKESQKEYHDSTVAQFSDQYSRLSADIETLKNCLKDSRILPRRIANCLCSLDPQENPGPVRRAIAQSSSPKQIGLAVSDSTSAPEVMGSFPEDESPAEDMRQESLRDL